MRLLCSIRGPRFPETAHPWRPTHSIKAIHDSLILMLVGLSRFISTVTSGNLLPDESITGFQPEMESECQATNNRLKRGAQPTCPRGHCWGLREPSDSEQTSQRAGTPRALGSSPRDLSIHSHDTQNQGA